MQANDLRQLRRRCNVLRHRFCIQILFLLLLLAKKLPDNFDYLRHVAKDFPYDIEDRKHQAVQSTIKRVREMMESQKQAAAEEQES